MSAAGAAPVSTPPPRDGAGVAAPPEGAAAAVASSAAPARERVLEVGPFRGSRAEWDELVEGDPHATYCHLSCWRRVMEDVLGHRSHDLEARDENGRLVGVLPLVSVRSRLTGHHLLSLPFLNYGGPVGTPAAQTLLAEEAWTTAASIGVDDLELRARHELRSSLEVRARKIAVLLDLPDDPDVLWKEAFTSKLRAQIRRPLKEGMEVRFGRDQLPAFYDVFARNMRDLGTPVLPKRYFEAVAKGLGERAVFVAVWWNGEPVAGAYGVVWRDEFEMVRASSLREHNRKAPNMLLYWSCMQEMISRGMRVFSFGRCTPGGGTHRFKRQWGARDVPLPWLAWSRSGGPGLPTAERPLFRLASEMWSRIPVAVANRVGPYLARRLP